ncbi:MAG: hypothetical protein GVY22_06375 [Gammaproteobacteria bacterium]|nr:hypothetical protein [Gammaproteobacteria bacterium]
MNRLRRQRAWEHGGIAPLLALVLSLSWVLLGAAPPAWAVSLWPEERQRLSVGLKLFPAVLGAQQGLEEKRRADGVLEVVVVYRGPDEAARQAAASLTELGAVQNMPLAVRTAAIAELEAPASPPFAAIFIATPGLEPHRLRELCARHQTLVFSPFAGDVAAGAVAGLHVSDRILPAVHLGHARRAGVQFKPFFLRIVHRVD